MLTEIEKVLPSEIEKRSFEIIAEELGDKQLIPGTESIVKRCIHTSADFDYADNLIFSENVVEKALKAIRGGASIVLPAMAERYIALCRMTMWRRRQKETKQHGRPRVWIRRQN